jgi:hypothetical protein
MKRAAGLHEEALFKHPPRREDCPICFLMLTQGIRGTGQTYSIAVGKLFVTDVVMHTWYNAIGNLLAHFADLPSLKLG